MTKIACLKALLNPTLQCYVNHGCPIFQLVKLVDGYDIPFVELTAVDFTGKVGQRIESCGFGPGYLVQACEPVEVVL